MDKEQVFQAVVKAIHSIEKSSGQTPSDVRPGHTPMDDLDGFDSLRGLEVTTQLEIELRITIDHKINLFLTQDGRRAAKIEDVVERVHSLIREQ